MFPKIAKSTRNIQRHAMLMPVPYGMGFYLYWMLAVWRWLGNYTVKSVPFLLS